jgi:hypothetical protein
MRLADEQEAEAEDAAQGAQQARDRIETLGRVVADLDLLNHKTEHDFLEIGSKLSEFIEIVNLISSSLTALMNLISGQQGQRASQSLAAALDRSREIKARYADRNGGLDSMRQKADLLKRSLAGFEGTVSTFHTLGVLTRIEIARIGNAAADFGSLADDVELLTGGVQTRVESAMKTAAILIPSIESTMQNISALEKGQARELPAAISDALASLESFHDEQSRVHASSVRLGSEYRAISDAFGRLIVSIQFHDITRQQVEHVMEALRSLSTQSEAEGRGVPQDPRRTASVLALQSSQLGDAARKFAASAASLAQSMDDIAEHVRAMAEESRALFGLRKGEKNSFFLEMERGCTAILASLCHSANAEGTILAANDGLANIIGQMRGSIDGILAIERQMRLMAMNARISACHLGATGTTLGVVADSIQQRAMESRKRSESMIGTLDSMSQVVARFRKQGDAVSADEGGNQEDCLEGIRRAVDELHSSGEVSSTQIGDIIAWSDRLCESLAATRRSLSVGALFAESISLAQGMLRGLEQGLRKRLKENSQCLLPREIDTWERGLEDFAMHYTMQAERDVHESIAIAAKAAEPLGASRSQQVECEAEECGELGENVEFF